PATSNQQPATSNQQPATSLILLSIFLCAYTEWTGYILGLSISVILYTEYFKIKNRKLSFYIIISLFLSAFITISHYIYAVGFDSISVIIERFTARNAGNNSITFIDLLNGHITSYNLFFVFLFISLPILVSNTKQRINNVHTILILSISILFENIIMLQHATQFSFDRLKMIIPLAILFSLIFIKGKSILRILLIIALTISSIYSITIYNKELARFKDWNIIDKRNIAFIHVIKNYIDFNCASFAMNLPVRGYDNLLIERGIIENISFDNFKQRNIGCGMVYFNTSRYSSDLNRYDMATIVLPNMQKIILRPVIQADWNQFITDSNWENGIA
ncbi:hypothetical protein, partial [Actinobacillus porcinus]|uniref:hypothetical protein n=1 Tax=Actinobacillus porcinus TaxID=51048 RepID=UPI0023559864